MMRRLRVLLLFRILVILLVAGMVGMVGMVGTLRGPGVPFEGDPIVARSGYAFGPGGLLYAFHIGVVEGLLRSKHQGIRFVPLAGASCGALAALSLRVGMPPEVAESAFWELVTMLRRQGHGRGTLAFLRAKLDAVLPSDAHELCNRGSNFYVQLLRVADPSAILSAPIAAPVPVPVLVSHFRSRAHLIEVVCASCRVPFVTTGGVGGGGRRDVGGGGGGQAGYDAFCLARLDPRISSMTPVDCFSFPTQSAPDADEIRIHPTSLRDLLSILLIPDEDARYVELMRQGRKFGAEQTRAGYS